MQVKEGDIFITKLERDFFGAFKVIRKGKSFFDESEGGTLMLGVLNYIDIEKPKISDSRLREILCRDRFSYNNNYCIEFFTDNEKYNRIKEYEFLGNLHLTEFELSLEYKLGDGRKGIKEGFPLSGVITPDFGNNMFLEWRWENEKDEFIEEVEKAKIESEKRWADLRKKQMKPKKMIEDQLFWAVIDKIKWDLNTSESQIQPAIDYLSKMKVSEIKQFKESLAYKLYLLDTREHARNIGEESYQDDNNHFSGDYFLYVRCCAIANGKDFFEKVLNDPKKMPKDLDFEELLSLPEEAYERKTKKQFDYDTGCDYETYSNFKGWE
jgi:hypothetical protein